MFREIKKRLLTIYDESEAHSLALVVMEEIGGVRMTQDLMEDCPFTDAVTEAVDRLLNHEPLQYVIGWCDFCGIRIKCDSRALIPRPETEWMVQRLISEDYSNVKRILDLGTGTGCIAIALASAFPSAHVTGVDISEQALALARENVSLCGLCNIDFVLGDITSLNIGGMFDMIVSNPPYITTLSEKNEMRNNVLDWEPHNALFVPDGDELLFHRSIVRYSKNHLSAGGVLVMEINEHLAETTKSLLENGSIIYDQFDKPRFVMQYG